MPRFVQPDQASVSAGAAIALSLATLAGGAAMLMLRVQPVGVAFMVLYAGASLFALFVLMRSEAGPAPRLLLTPLLLASDFAMVIAGDPFGYTPTTGKLAAVAAAPGSASDDAGAPPEAERDPRSAGEVVAAVEARTAAAPGPQVRMRTVAVAGGGDAVDWSLSDGTGERQCGRVTLFGDDRRAQVEILAQIVAHARRDSQGGLSCGDDPQNAQAAPGGAQGDRDAR